MKAKEIRDLIDFIAQSPLDEVHIETDEFKISVKRHSGGAKMELPSSSTPFVPAVVSTSPVATPTSKPEPQTDSTEAKPSASGNYLTIKSPMIGTFYRAPKPDAPNFVNVGDEIKPGQVVCIVEAMKLFNEIESEVAGRIVKVLVENASPVEYDQPLFLVEPL
ncbi:acetyl-CoA carboxylase biotin carboxyl carrier protein [Raineya orbicola]|jgi:acetyl-CoA carboxylase biotin carboxyl carrier protein|uniref:Biotin carboxyl carrier protein of acetyl-CoA carboxylase n=1 Tax=Raineya orbicola TaxID=2016530 RepID=A0A2N3IKY0_9BACT|nr:acetyl-CoA carboxylase biotin carboxyl carrier protein [Raineya orbicola]PKQ70883.1 BCCP: acetyl-CoA carboxylase, biotin carboxyl carrier protein [Raineya orbicola]